jgi:hypothetical protein
MEWQMFLTDKNSTLSCLCGCVPSSTCTRFPEVEVRLKLGACHRGPLMTSSIFGNVGITAPYHKPPDLDTSVTYPRIHSMELAESESVLPFPIIPEPRLRLTWSCRLRASPKLTCILSPLRMMSRVSRIVPMRLNTPVFHCESNTITATFGCNCPQLFTWLVHPAAPVRQQPVPLQLRVSSARSHSGSPQPPFVPRLLPGLKEPYRDLCRLTTSPGPLAQSICTLQCNVSSSGTGGVTLLQVSSHLELRGKYDTPRPMLILSLVGTM